MRKFQAEKMRRTMYEWHGGQSSSLYAAASSGLVESMPALQRELRQCAESLWNDSSNFRYFNFCQRDAGIGKVPTQSTMRASMYREYCYLKDLAEYLPVRFKTEIVVSGRTYIVLPWVSRSYFGNTRGRA